MDPLFSPFHSKRTSGPFFQFSFSHFFARGREYINQEWTEIREGKPGLASFKIQSLLLLAPRTKESPAYFLHRPNPKVTSLFMYFAFFLHPIRPSVVFPLATISRQMRRQNTIFLPGRTLACSTSPDRATAACIKRSFATDSGKRGDRFFSLSPLLS